MSFSNGDLSAADVAAVMGNGNGNLGLGDNGLCSAESELLPGKL